MAVYVPKFNSGKQTSSTSFYNVGSDSSAKKYASVDQIQNNNPTDSTSNTEHIIMAAMGVRSLSSAVMAVAAQARKDVKSAISAILNSEGNVDPTSRKPPSQYTEEDVNNIQSRVSQAASSMYNSAIGASMLNELSVRTHNFIVDSRYSFIPPRSENATNQTINVAVPQIENVLIDLDPRKGTTDSFYAGITFNISQAQLADVKLIRVFRATVKDPIYTRPIASLSSIGVQKISTPKGRKNVDSTNMSLTRVEENNVDNAISDLGALNPFTGLAMAANSDGSLIIPPPIPGQYVPLVDDPNIPEAFHHLDKSVLENINVLFNLQSNPVFGFHVSPVTSSIGVGNNISLNLGLGRAQRAQQRSNDSNGVVVIDSDNQLMFREISHFSPEACFSQKVGDIAEFYFADDSVTYGGGYKYFIVTVDKQMAQSARSAVVDAVVEAIRVPPRPQMVDASVDEKSVTLAMIVEDQLVEKFEIHRMDTNPNRKSQVIAEVISGQAGFTIEPVLRDIQSNNFVLVGECLNNQRFGATFIDKDVVPGHPYIYRVYSVDIFGNKSESPFEVSAYISDAQDHFVPLKAPSIMAEVDAKTKKMRITFSSNEPTIQRMRLERRDMTSGETDFSAPGSPSRVIMGYGREPLKNRISLQGELLAGRDPDNVWTGFFMNTGKTQVFIDQSVQFDHVYQYRIFGEDRYGNRSSHGFTSPIVVLRRPMINTPTNLRANTVWDDQYNIQGIQVNWDPGSLDVSAEDMFGNQTTLANSSVRTLYQMQRQEQNQEVWENFPLTQNLALMDTLIGINGDVAPNFRPSYPILNRTYNYRVQAVQVGNYVSNYTDVVYAFLGFPVAPPEFFILRTPSVYTQPFFIMLNWDTPTLSGVVDRWDIERSEINNFAASKLNIQTEEAFAALSYRSFRSVYRESSRFSSREVDKLNSTQDLLNSALISGEHYYMDNQVDFGNSYFYRIRAIDMNGNASTWVYKGMKVTSRAFEHKWVPLYTDEEKKRLALNLQPAMLTRGVRKYSPSSLGLLPSYCTPNSFRISPRIAYDIFGNAA